MLQEKFVEHVANYCQFYKEKVQHHNPPVLKIAFRSPFQMVSMDLMRFPNSTSGNVAALVAVDHTSKWMSAVPVKNKSAKTVADSLRSKIFPSFVKVPESILTDNGMEFCGRETEQVLSDYNIQHLYSSPYSPSSNGAVERVNKTLINIIRGLVNDDNHWDKIIYKAVMIYNNTYHSQLKCSPVEFLLKKEHELSNQLPIDGDCVQTWKEGHPNFKPYSVGQKVIKSIARIGDRASYKLQPKFDGPFVVEKIQSNGLSYEVRRENSHEVTKCHHRKLRSYHELPFAIKRFVPDINETCMENEEELSNQPSEEELSIPGYCMGHVSSDSLSFEGFSVMSDKQEDVRRESPQFEECEEKKKDCEMLQNMDGKKSIHELHCSEPVTPDLISSTPNTGSKIRFDEYLQEHSLSKVFNNWNHTITVQEELLSCSEDKLSELSNVFDSMKEVLNKAMLEGYEEAEFSDEMVLEGESNNFTGFNLEKSSDSRIEDLREIIKVCRTNLENSRSRSRDLRRDIWKYRCQKGASILSEASAVLEEGRDLVPLEINPVQSSSSKESIEVTWKG